MSETAPSGVNRRQHERKYFRGAAYLLFAGREPIEVRTLDLSAGGLSIVAPANPAINTVVMIRINIPRPTTGADGFEVRVRVAHTMFSQAEDGFKIGLEFVNLTVPLATAILQFLKTA